MNQHRVVVTGMSAVTPIGIGLSAFWEGLKTGKNGISKITHFDATDFRSQVAGEVHDFKPEDWLDAKSLRHMDRFTQFAIAASTMALKDAGLTSHSHDPTRIGVSIGSGIGGSKTIEEGQIGLTLKGPRSMHPFFVPKVIINMAPCLVSIQFGFKGPLSAPCMACSTGSNAIGDAFRMLQRGDADIIVAGSSEGCITPLPFGGFCATRSMTSNPVPEKASRPFDKNRDGFVMGEGAGIAILENLDNAQKRGAKIYAEIVGYGNTADAYHFTAPEPSGDGMIRAMQNALKDGDVAPETVGYINAHGTSTTLNDKTESKAIMEVFGDHAWRLKISSIKSMIGHLLAGAGSVEFVATVMALHTGVLPPTINYEEPDPECPLDYITQGAESRDLEAAINNSFGFGGGNVCLAVRKFRE